jgi:hypothetical protein
MSLSSSLDSNPVESRHGFLVNGESLRDHHFGPDWLTNLRTGAPGEHTRGKDQQTGDNPQNGCFQGVFPIKGSG